MKKISIYRLIATAVAIAFTLPTFATNMARENQPEKPLVEKYNAYKASKV